MPRRSSRRRRRTIHAGAAPAAAVFTSLAVVNAHAASAVTGSLSPTAGSLLIAAVFGATAADPTFGGTLTGSWVKIDRITNSVNVVQSVYYCKDPGASGTVSVSNTGAAGTALTVTQVVGAWNATNPIRQSKTDLNPADPMATSFDNTVTWSTWYALNPTGAGTVGAGWSQLDTSTTWEALLTAYSGAGSQVMRGSSADNAGVVGIELAY